MNLWCLTFLDEAALADINNCFGYHLHHRATAKGNCCRGSYSAVCWTRWPPACRTTTMAALLFLYLLTRSTVPKNLCREEHRSIACRHHHVHLGARHPVGILEIGRVAPAVVKGVDSSLGRFCCTRSRGVDYAPYTRLGKDRTFHTIAASADAYARCSEAG